MPNKIKILFEEPFTLNMRGNFPLKYDFVAMIPNSPATNNQHFLEEIQFMSVSAINKQVNEAKISIPFNIHGPPECLTEVTFEE